MNKGVFANLLKVVNTVSYGYNIKVKDLLENEWEINLLKSENISE